MKRVRETLTAGICGLCLTTEPHFRLAATRGWVDAWRTSPRPRRTSG